MNKSRHSWMNYPANSKQKCTQCGLIKETNRRGVYAVAYYKHGVKLDRRPDCVKGFYEDEPQYALNLRFIKELDDKNDIKD